MTQKNVINNGVRFRVAMGDNDPAVEVGAQLVGGFLHVAFVPVTVEATLVPDLVYDGAVWRFVRTERSQYVPELRIRIFERTDADTQ